MDPRYLIRNPEDLPTPALVVYRDLVRENIDRIGRLLGGYGKLRPHIKTHKCSEILKMQMAVGILRYKCATPKEAEMAAAAGVRDLVVAYPLIGPSARRVASLKARFPDLELAVLADEPESVDGLCKAAVDADVELGVFVELNTGQNRTGVPGPERALEIARRIADSPGLRLAGVHFYDGHIKDADEKVRAQRAEASVRMGREAKALIERNGLAVPKLVTSGSPTFAITARYPEVDEVSPGTWIFWDKSYTDSFSAWFAWAALVVARVVSHPAPRIVTVDAGSKSISTDGTPHAQALNWPEAKFLIRNEEHLVIELPEGVPPPGVGDLVYLLPHHICPTVNLWDEIRVVDGQGRFCETWPVDARGH